LTPSKVRGRGGGSSMMQVVGLDGHMGGAGPFRSCPNNAFGSWLMIEFERCTRN